MKKYLLLISFVVISPIVLCVTANRKGGDVMIKEATLIALPIEFFQLRVLMWKERDICAGQCLETGSVATADDTNTLKHIMQELLIDEVEYNINGVGSASNLFGSPAPRHVWQQYYELSHNRNADLVGGINMLDATF